MDVGFLLAQIDMLHYSTWIKSEIRGKSYVHIHCKIQLESKKITADKAAFPTQNI